MPKTEGTSGWVDNTAATLSRLKLHVAELDELLSEYEAERAVAWMFIGFRQQPPTTKFQSDVFAGFAQCEPPCELAPCWHPAFHPSPSIWCEWFIEYTIGSMHFVQRASMTWIRKHSATNGHIAKIPHVNLGISP